MLRIVPRQGTFFFPESGQTFKSGGHRELFSIFEASRRVLDCVLRICARGKLDAPRIGSDLSEDEVNRRRMTFDFFTTFRDILWHSDLSPYKNISVELPNAEG